MSTMLRVAGKGQTFSRAQIDALLQAFHDLYAEEQKKRSEPLTQTDVGDALHTTQQTAGKLIRRKTEGGISYAVGTMIARNAGYSGVDQFFAIRGLFDGEDPHDDEDADPCPNRAHALRRLAGLLVRPVVERIRAEPMGPMGDLPEAEWCRLALDEQFQRERRGFYEHPTPAPPKRRSGRRAVASRGKADGE